MHTHTHKFDPAHVAKLENPARYDWLNPKTVADLFEVTGNETLVEYGCGTGFFTIDLARKVPMGNVIGVDISPEILDFFRDKLEKLHEKAANEESSPEEASHLAPKNIELMLISGVPSPIADESVDGILAINLLHELEGEWEVLGDLHRILNPGGRLVIVDWLAMERPAGPPSDHCLDPDRALALLNEAGFELLDQPEKAKESFPYHYTYILGKKG